MLAEDGEASPDILPYEMVASVSTHTIAGKPEELHIDLNALPVYVARTGQHIQCLSLKGDIIYGWVCLRSQCRLWNNGAGTVKSHLQRVVLVAPGDVLFNAPFCTVPLFPMSSKYSAWSGMWLTMPQTGVTPAPCSSSILKSGRLRVLIFP